MSAATFHWPSSCRRQTVMNVPHATVLSRPLEFGELLATSDLPAGVLNILTGYRAELVPTFATHTHIRGVEALVTPDQRKELALGAAESVKRLRARTDEKALDWLDDVQQSLYEIRNFVEFKTVWHPIGA